MTSVRNMLPRYCVTSKYTFGIDTYSAMMYILSMKILKHGIQKKPITFTCSDCKCEFITEPNEYFTDTISRFHEAKIKPFYVPADTRTEVSVYACACPECGHYCYVDRSIIDSVRQFTLSVTNAQC